ncbi:signal transduction histidine kinase [Anaerotaenia torta]|uniref:sensor histidine kinase n=1 Tax=Anaerotaenia torta TaxID=433293 RepID=UPI003D216C1A
MIKRLLHRKWHIKPRIFAMLLLLMTIVFSSIHIAFNLFTNQYIRSNVEIQLDDLTNNFGMKGGNHQNNPQDELRLPDLSGQRPNKIGAHGEVIVLNSNYEVKEYNVFSINEDTDELVQIANHLKNKNIDLADAKYVRVDTAEGVYYVSSVKDANRPDRYFVFYVSVAGINNLVDAINFAMAVIMAIAMLICFVIANRIAGSVTQPLKKLSKFAEEIGKGNFTRNRFEFSDIEFDELGEAMNQSAEKLDLYDKDQRAFFQNVSHELRTPLQSIRCYAEGAECGLMDAKKSGATIITETDRLSELVEDLLYISRVDSITSHVEKHENDLRDTLALCAEAQKPLADKNGIRFEYLFDDQPVMFSYNEKHMYRALSNLISNALRYAQTKVTLICRQSGKQIEVSVIDDGKGISSEDLPHIFERFYKGRDGKHGIGLAIVKSVIEIHGGKISVSCEHGTCFTMIFNR